MSQIKKLESRGVPRPIAQGLYAWLGERTVVLEGKTSPDVDNAPAELDFDKLVSLMSRAVTDMAKMGMLQDHVPYNKLEELTDLNVLIERARSKRESP